jgi:poly-gamma-glutamate synthesis protein (capsule biosynthesis protein)
MLPTILSVRWLLNLLLILFILFVFTSPAFGPVMLSERPVTINLVGDIMLDRGVRYKVDKYAAGDYYSLFTHVPMLGQADITFGNLEGPMSDKGRNVGSIYSFRMAPEAAPVLAQAGFDVLSVANNHSGDWTIDALLDTVVRLKAVNIAPVGAGDNLAEISEPQIVTVRGKKVGFLAASDVGPEWLAANETTPGILLANNPRLAEIITAAASKVDYLIVSFHFGEEYQPQPNARQHYLAHLAIDAGAKVVVGSHPHVLEPIEEYHGGLIAYSLGNFIFDQGFSSETRAGAIWRVSLWANKVSYALQPTWANELYQPTIPE